MKKVGLIELEAGMVAAEPIFSQDGRQVLFPAGSPLTERAIRMIGSWGITHVMIIEEGEIPPEPEPQVEQAVLEALPEVMAKRSINFSANLETAITQVTEVFDTIRSEGLMDMSLLREVSGKINQHLTQPSEAINKLLFRISACPDRDYLAHHSITVAALSGMLAGWMELPPKVITEVVLAGLLHDIGKTKIPRTLIVDHNPDADRQEMLRKHVALSVELLKDIPNLSRDVLTAIAHHHEYKDGTGYPQGLSGGAIHQYADIIAVANRLSHMAGDSIGMNPFTLAETIKREMFNKLDPTVCDTFNRRINDYLMNNPVKLSDGRKAKVVFLPSVNPTSPVLKTEDDQFIDLTKTKELTIVGLTF